MALLDVEPRRRGPRQAKADWPKRLGRSRATSPNGYTVRAAFGDVVSAFGGVDIVVSNAGFAWQGRIGEVDDAILAQKLRAQFLRSPALSRKRR